MSNHTDSTGTDRTDGRRQGQGWYLERLAKDWLWYQGYWGYLHQFFWGREVDLLAVEDECLLRHRDGNPGVSSPLDDPPTRLVVSCMDWHTKAVTPCRVNRLLVHALTARAHPVIVCNHRQGLSPRAQQIAEAWRVRVVTDHDIEDDAPLPPPETRDPFVLNGPWPAPLNRDVPMERMYQPNYEL